MAEEAPGLASPSSALLLMRSRLPRQAGNAGPLPSMILHGPRFEYECAAASSGGSSRERSWRLTVIRRNVPKFPISVQECKTNDLPTGRAPVVKMHYSASYRHESFNH